eukprot:UN08947
MLMLLSIILPPQSKIQIIQTFPQTIHFKTMLRN